MSSARHGRLAALVSICLLAIVVASSASAASKPPKPIKVSLDVFVDGVSATPNTTISQMTKAKVKDNGTSCPSAKPAPYNFRPISEKIGDVEPKDGENEFLTTLYLKCGKYKLYLLGAIRVDSNQKVTAGWWGVWEASGKYRQYRSCGSPQDARHVGSGGDFSGQPTAGKPLHVTGTLKSNKDLCTPDDQ